MTAKPLLSNPRLRKMALDLGAIGAKRERSTLKDIRLLPPHVLSPWWRREGHRLDIADLGEVFAYAPDVLIIGTGAHGLMKVHEETRVQLESRGIEVEVMPTERACKRFGELFCGGKKVAGAFHLTC